MNFGFLYPLKEVSLKSCWEGGNINLWINGNLINVTNPMNLIGTYSGATISVANIIGNIYNVSLAGNIISFSIGGQELYIDDVSAKK